MVSAKTQLWLLKVSFLVALVAGLGDATRSGGPRVAHVTFVPGLNPDVRGNLIFEQEDPEEPVIIRGTIHGLSDGYHGFHVHQFGELSNNCLDAGEHFNPTRDPHGGPRDVRKHVGDFGNVKSKNGEADVYVEAPDISLFEGPTSILGRAVVVHVAEDDLGRGRNPQSLLTGNAGGRAGCGIIKLEGASGSQHQIHRGADTVHSGMQHQFQHGAGSVHSDLSHHEAYEHAAGHAGAVGQASIRGSSHVPQRAGTGKDHIFEVGKRYGYSFQTWMTTGIPEIAPQYAGFSLKGILAVEPVDESAVAFTLTDVTAKSFNEKTDGSVDPEMGETMEIEGMMYLQRTVTVYFSGGKVIGLTSSDEKEPVWVTNFHKSIASQLQFQWASDKEQQAWIVKSSAFMEPNSVYNVREESPTGDCEVWYEISKIPITRIQTDPSMIPLQSECSPEQGVFEIVKTRSLDKCKKGANFNIMTPVGLNCKLSSSGCETTAQRTSNTRVLACGPLTSHSGMTIQRITTVEKLSVDPFGHNTEGLEGTTFVRLELASVKPATGISAKAARLRGEPTIKSLIYSYFPTESGSETTALPQPSIHESEFSMIFKTMHLGQKIKPMLESIVSDLRSSEFESTPASKFISDRLGGLRRLISYMGYEELQASVSEILGSSKEGSVSRQMLTDALMSSGSNPSVLLTLELVAGGHMSTERSLQAISMLPLVVRTPTRELLGVLMKFLTTAKKTEDLQKTMALAVTQLIHHACISKNIKKTRFPVESMGDFCKPDEPFILEQLLPWLKSQLDSAETTGDKVAYFAALNNLGHEGIVPIVAPYIEECSGRESRHRRSQDVDFSQFKHEDTEESELEALNIWKRILMAETKAGTKQTTKKEGDKDKILQEMQKLMAKYAEESETENQSKLTFKTAEKRTDGVQTTKKKTKLAQEGPVAKMNKDVLKAVMEMMEAENEEEAETAQKKLVASLGKVGSACGYSLLGVDTVQLAHLKGPVLPILLTQPTSTITPYTSNPDTPVPHAETEKVSQTKLKAPAIVSEETSIPKLRKKIMKVVSMLVDAETEEDLEKAKVKLEKMVIKAKGESAEDEEENEDEVTDTKSPKETAKEAKIKTKILQVEKEYERELQEMEQRQRLEDAKMKLEVKKAKLSSKRSKRMIHGTKSVFDQGDCQIIRSKAVFSLSKLAYGHNKRVMPILKSLYFNTAEDYQVRLASLTLIIASNPPLGIWERIAIGTWFDPHPDVVSFFYSTLKSLSMSTNPKLKESQRSASAVLHLAKPSVASPSASWNMLSGQFSELDVLGYMLQMSSFGSSSSYLPDNYYTRFTMQMGVGSNTVFELSKYGKHMEKFIDTIMVGLVKAGITEPDVLSKASSALENIHRQLFIEERAAGAPESHIYFSLMESIQRLITIDEGTVKRVVEAFSKSEFTGGIPLSFYKWLPLVDVTSIIPSESGIPFTFNSHSRIFASVRGTVKGKLMEKAVEANVFPTATLKLYSQMAVDIPFSTKIVASGVDTHISFALPGTFTTGFSKSAKSVTFSYEPSTSISELVSLTHLHVRPFTVAMEKKSLFQPMSVSKELTMVTSEEDPKTRSIDHEDTFGFRYKIASTKDIGSAFRASGPSDIISSLLLGWVPGSLRLREYSALMDVRASETSRLELTVSLGKVSKRPHEETRSVSKKQNTVTRRGASHFESEWGPLTEDMESHSENILQDFTEGEAMLASVHVYPTTKGSRTQKKHSLHFGLGTSSSRRRHAFGVKASKGETAMVCVDGSFSYPEVPAVRRENFHGANLKTSWSVNVGFGSSCKDRTIEITGHADRSQEAESKYRRSRQFADCARFEKIGQGVSEQCTRLRREATSLDKYSMDIKYENLPAYYINSSMAIDDRIRLSMLRYATHNELDVKNQKGQVHVELDLIPFTNLANLRIYRPSSNTFFTGIQVPSYLTTTLPMNARVGPQLTVMHPEGSPICLIDRNHITTFDKVSYNASLSGCNHVLAKDCSGRTKIAVLGRQEGNKKVVTILASTESIELDPTAGIVTVNNEPVRLSSAALKLETEQGSEFARISKTEDGFIIAELPEHGMTVKMNQAEIVILPSVVHKGRTCGICGFYDNLKDAEFRGPTGCVLSSGALMVEAYKLQKPLGISERESRLECGKVNRRVEQLLKEEQSACHEVGGAHYNPGVIRTRITELATALVKAGSRTQACAKIMRTRVEKREGMTCFSTEPAPACKPGCKPVGLVQQRLQFHCMEPGARVDRYVAEHNYHPLHYFADAQPSLRLAVSAPIDCRPE